MLHPLHVFCFTSLPVALTCRAALFAGDDEAAARSGQRAAGAPGSSRGPSPSTSQGPSPMRAGWGAGGGPPRDGGRGGGRGRNAKLWVADGKVRKG